MEIWNRLQCWQNRAQEDEPAGSIHGTRLLSAIAVPQVIEIGSDSSRCHDGRHSPKAEVGSNSTACSNTWNNFRVIHRCTLKFEIISWLSLLPLLLLHVKFRTSAEIKVRQKFFSHMMIMNFCLRMGDHFLQCSWRASSLTKLALCQQTKSHGPLLCVYYPSSQLPNRRILGKATFEVICSLFRANSRIIRS
jgi:hypothetical protein